MNPARVILSGAKQNRTFSSEIPNDALHRLLLALCSDFDSALDDTDEKAPQAGSRAGSSPIK